MGDKHLGEKQDNYSPELLKARTYSNFITIPQTTIDYNQLHNELSQLKHTTYLITKLEQHKNEGKHIHIIIKLSQQIRISAIHNVIMKQQGAITGLINYQKPDNINASIQYLKKEETSVADEPYLEYGTKPKEAGRPLKHSSIIQLAEEGDIKGAIELIKTEMTKDYLIHKDTIEANIEKIAKPPLLKYDIPTYEPDNITLTEQQQLIWDTLQPQPKARRIIWVTGNYGSGKTFLANYITANHQYGVYDAGQSASIDNVVYGYNEEGVIMWDLPRTFDFSQYGEAIANVIEKFSDFGQILTSKKYAGKRTTVRGHVVVFSNHEPIELLKHRNIIHINLTPQEKEDKHQFSDSTDSDSEYQPPKARILRYNNTTRCRLDHPIAEHSKTFTSNEELQVYIDNNNIRHTIE